MLTKNPVFRAPQKKSVAFAKNTIPTFSPFVSGKGSRLIDSNGREYIDFCSQTLNANLGQCHEAVHGAVYEQLSRLSCVSSRFSTPISIELHEKLVAITPAPLTKVNLASVCGTLANECAIKAARKKTQNTTVIAVKHSHHGQSFEAMRFSGKHWSRNYIANRNTHFMQPPACSNCPIGKTRETCQAECLDQLEETAVSSQGNLSALIIEPIMVDAGVLVPPPVYHHRIREICDDYDIPLIWDEVQTAFGWLGVMFAMDYYRVTPDILTLAKGLGAGFPLGATIFKEEYDVLEYGEHELTPGSHPLSCAASLAMINHLETSDELGNVVRKGDILSELLERVRERHPCVKEIRGVGLLRGIEFVDPATEAPDSKFTLAVFERLLKEGIITRTSKVGLHSNILQVKPPLIISLDEIQEFADKLDGVLCELGR